MRKIKFFTMLTAITALMAGISSCNNEDDLNEGGPVEEGKATQMTLSISFPNDETRATGDPNATEAEAAVKTVDVFIYSGAGAFLSYTSVNMSQFDAVSGGTGVDKYTYKTTIPTTTGEKYVYAGINLPAGLAATLKGKNRGELSTVARTLTRADLIGDVATNGLPMFSSTPENPTFVDDNTGVLNTVNVQVERLVAKVTVEAASGGIDDSGVTGMGTLGKLQFAINNFNERMYLVQGLTPDYKDPNWDSNGLANFNPAEFSDATTYVDVYTAGTTPGVDDYNVCYASENTSKEKLKGEITRATVRATFIPKTITVYDNGVDNTDGYKTATSTKSTAVTFWAVTPTSGATAFFETKSIADAYAADNGGTVLEYTDGYCYWDMFLNKKTGTNKAYQWDVLRNEYFKCTISRIAALGRNTPEVVPPGVTPDEDTNMLVNIEVLYWNTPVIADYELAP